MIKIQTSKKSSDFIFWVSYFLLLFAFFIMRKGGTNHIQYYDAKYYITLSQSFLNDHHWSILNFPNTIRGYFFPFILNLFQHFFTIPIGIVLINMLCLLLLSVFILPYMSANLFATPFSKTKSVLFSLIFIYFWGGYIYYALTDIIAITLLLLAVVFVSKKNYWGLFFGGIAIAATFNIRPIYQLNLALFMLYLAWDVFTKNIRLRGFIFFLCGATAVLTPQIIINYHNNHSYSPFVMTNALKNKEGSLYQWQLEHGLGIEKYETYVGDLSKYPFAGVVYTNGDALYNQYLQSSEQRNLAHYIKFALLNPIKMSQIYLIHLFNGLDIKANTAYISKIKLLLSIHLISIINYIVLIFGAINLILNFKNTAREKKINTRKLFIYLNIFLPILFVIPVIVEIRFFLPLFILLYLSFLQFTALSNWQNKKDALLYLFITAFLVVGACFISNTMSLDIHGLHGI